MTCYVDKPTLLNVSLGRYGYTGRGTATSSKDIHAFLQPVRQPRVELVNLLAGGEGANVRESQGDESRKGL